MPQAAAARAAALRAEIAAHDRRYYQEDAPTVSDAEYDALFRELQALESDYPALVTADSPTQRVSGARAAEFAPLRIASPCCRSGPKPTPRRPAPPSSTRAFAAS